MRIEWYWHTFRYRLLPVTFHLDKPRLYWWRGIYGVHVGGVFVGIVRSTEHTPL